MVNAKLSTILIRSRETERGGFFLAGHPWMVVDHDGRIHTGISVLFVAES